MLEKADNRIEPTNNLPYSPPNPGEISIVASTPYLGMNEINRSVDELKSVLAELAECRFNLFHTNFNVYYNNEDHKLFKLLQATYETKTINGNNLKLLFGGGRMKSIHAEDIKRMFEDFVGISYNIEKVTQTNGSEKFQTVKVQDKDLKERAISVFGGVSQEDEPVYCQLTPYSALLPCYNYINEQLSHNFPYLNKFVYINLYGAVTEKSAMGLSYEEYINLYNKNFKPSFFSYDAYPIKKNRNGVYIDSQYFYDDLEIFSNIFGYTNENGTLERIPFWAFYLGTGYTLPTLSEFHPAPTEPYLRITAFSALAYGAKGISCWVYHQRPNESNEIYFGAPINLEDKKSASWYYVNKINMEIRKYNDVFFKSELVDCVHFGYSGSSRTKEFKDTFHCINKLDMNKGGAMISCLQEKITLSSNPDKPVRYIVIVSHDINTYQDVHIEFFPNFTIYELTPKTNNGTVSNSPLTLNEKLNVNRTLIPGGYLIFKFL